MTSPPRDSRDRTERLLPAAAAFSKKWQPAIVDVLLQKGGLGFNDLQDRLDPVSAKVLSESLDDLRERDVVERRVLSESPLRVEYDLTRKGQDLEPVVEALLRWSDEHVVDESPTVLVADDDRRVLDMHADWIGEFNDVVTATTRDGVVDAVESGVDAAVVDRGMGRDGREVTAELRRRTDVPVLVLTSIDPGFDLVDLHCDGYLQKPTDPSTLRSRVDDLLSRREEDDRTREFLALRSRKRAIDAAKSSRQREESEAYARLVDRIEELERRLDRDGESPPAGRAADAT